jgi:DnaJ-class molecular chaperone
MSPNNSLEPLRPTYACTLCGEEIQHDVVRVDGGRIYHMSCFNQKVNAGKRELRACPTCQTLGALWNWDHSEWTECDVCKGTGYLVGTQPIRGSRGQGPEPCTAC